MDDNNNTIKDNTSEDKTKMCKHCAMRIPYSARVCPFCRKRADNRNVIIFIIVIIGLFLSYQIYMAATESDRLKRSLNDSIREINESQERIRNLEKLQRELNR